ncbi:MAG: hypothetical protein AAF488_00365 [Planctomycetota bacterium]
MTVLLCCWVLMVPADTAFGVEVPAAGYAKALAGAVEEKVEVHGLSVRLRIHPDLYRLRMAEGLEKLHAAGHRGSSLESELKKLHREVKSLSNKAGVEVALEGVADKTYFFLQKKPEKHLKVKGGASLTGRAEQVAPKLEFAKWTVFAGSAVRKVTLAHFNKVRFDVMIRLKKDPKKSIELSLVDLIRYVPVRQSEHDRKGINIPSRQISHGNFKDLVMEPIKFSLVRAKWKLPPAPAGFDSILEALK